MPNVFAIFYAFLMNNVLSERNIFSFDDEKSSSVGEGGKNNKNSQITKKEGNRTPQTSYPIKQPSKK